MWRPSLLICSLCADLEEHCMVRAMAASRKQQAVDLASDQGSLRVCLFKSALP